MSSVEFQENPQTFVAKFNKNPGGAGGTGEKGATFTPSVAEDGTLSWSNDKGLPNPDPVNIKGGPGEQGPVGPQGEPGFSPSVEVSKTINGIAVSVTNATGTTTQAFPFFNEHTFASGDTLNLTEGAAEYRGTGEIGTLVVNYPAGQFEAWLKFITAASGAVTITLPTSQYIGEAPVFGNGETWELSIKDGVIVAAKCE